MKKLLCSLLAAVMLLGLTACAVGPDISLPESSAPAADLSEDALIAAAKANLNVPDGKGIAATVSEKYYWEAGGRYCVDVSFYEYGVLAAGAAVDPTDGALLRDIYKYTTPDSTPARDAFIKVLNSEQIFTVKGRLSGKAEQHKLNQLNVGAQYAFTPQRYAFVDMDRDGGFELIVGDASQNGYLVLRYQGGGVCGYVVDYRAMLGLRSDGRFRGSAGAGIFSIGSMTFNNLEYTVTELAYQDQPKGVYRLGGSASDQMSVEGYFDSWQLMPEAKWFQFDF